MKKDFTKQMQSYVAETCIGSSALRNQGCKGLIDISRDYFKRIILTDLPSTVDAMRDWLDKHTDELKSQFPAEGRSFGGARKALNLFLRCTAYNVYLSKAFDLSTVLPVLELPLDSYSAKHLLVGCPDIAKRWVGLKAVTKEAHADYQMAALTLAKEWEVNRVDLDVYFYREEPTA